MADVIKVLSYLTSEGVEEAFDPQTSTAAVVGLDEALALKADLDSPELTGTPTAPTAEAGTETTQIATTAFVATAVNAAMTELDAVVYQGVVNSNDELPSDPANGDLYKIGTAGTYADQECEVGDMIIAKVTDGEVEWNVIQANIDGAVTGPASSVDGDIAIFDGTTGKIIADSGTTIADLTYTHPDSGVTEGTYDSVTVDAQGHVTAGTTYTAEELLAATGITSSADEIDAAVASSSTVYVVSLSADEEVPSTLAEGGLIIRDTE